MLNDSSNNTMMYDAWREPFALRVTRLLVFACIVLGSLFGNSLIIQTVLALSTKRTPMTYILVMNLAIAELLNTVLLPFMIAYDEMVNWIFGQFCCQLISPLQNVANTVITSSVAAIAACRCCFLVLPQQANRLQRQRYAIGIVLLLWTMALAINFPNFLFSQKVESLFHKDTYWCITLLPGDTVHTFPSTSYKALILVQIAFSFLLNSTVMIISYGIVLYKIRNSSVYVNNSARDYDQNETVCTLELSTQTRESQLSIKKQAEQTEKDKDQGEEDEQTAVQSMENDVFKMFYAIVLVFVLGYFPYQIVFLMEYFKVITWRWRYLIAVRRYLLLLTCLPSALHPICYGLMTKFYAKAFRKIILCH